MLEETNWSITDASSSMTKAPDMIMSTLRRDSNVEYLALQTAVLHINFIGVGRVESSLVSGRIMRHYVTFPLGNQGISRQVAAVPFLCETFLTTLMLRLAFSGVEPSVRVIFFRVYQALV